MFAELVEALAPDRHWREAYAAVKKSVVQFLSEHGDKKFSAIELVEAMMPAAETRGAGANTARRRMFKALRALAHMELKEWVTKGAPRKVFGKLTAVNLWSKPAQARPCSFCNGTGIEPG